MWLIIEYRQTTPIYIYLFKSFAISLILFFPFVHMYNKRDSSEYSSQLYSTQRIHTVCQLTTRRRRQNHSANQIHVKWHVRFTEVYYRYIHFKSIINKLSQYYNVMNYHLNIYAKHSNLNSFWMFITYSRDRLVSLHMAHIHNEYKQAWGMWQWIHDVETVSLDWSYEGDGQTQS